MVPMIDPMVPEATLLFAISPAFLGVLLAMIAAVAISIAGSLRELQRRQAAAPGPTTAAAVPPKSSRLAA